MSHRGPKALVPLPERDMDMPAGGDKTPSEVSVNEIRDIANHAQNTGTRKRQLRWLLVLLALIAGALALRFTVFAPKPVPVKVQRVTRGDVEQTVTNTRAGTVKARLRANLSPEIGGRVVALPFREGSRVKKGDLLLRLEYSVQRAHLELATEDVRTAEAQADEVCLSAGLAETELQRALDLNEGGVISHQIVDRRRSERDRSQATCRAGKARLDQAHAQKRLTEAELARTVLRAPFDGVIADMSTELGEWITPAPPGVPIPPIMDLIDRTSAFVEAPIDEMDAERVKVGQVVRVNVDSRRGQHFKGKLVRVAAYVLDVVEQNRTVEIEAELEDLSVASSLLPGTSADIEVILTRSEDVLVIPTGAIGPGSNVLVVVDGQLIEKTITPGLRNWRTTEVKAGLDEGELVVVSRDSPDIQPGALVVIEEEA